MSSIKTIETPTFDTRLLFFALFDGAVGFIAMAVIVSLAPPLHLRSSSEMISATARHQFSVLTNYAEFAAITMATLLMAGVALRRRRSLFLPVAWGKLNLPRLIATLSILAVGFAIISNTKTVIDAPLEDGFHEGEYLGFLPAFDAHGLSALFLVHGFGVDVAPSVVAHAISPAHGIVLTRSIRLGLQMLALAFAFIVVALSVRLSLRNVAPHMWLPLAAIGFIASVRIFGEIPASQLAILVPMGVKDTFFLLELMLMLGYATYAIDHPLRRRAVALLLGAALPLGFFYTYDRSLLAVVLTGLLTLPLAALGTRVVLDWLMSLTAGCTLGVLLTLKIVGLHALQSTIYQIQYWIKNGDVLWATPLMSQGVFAPLLPPWAKTLLPLQNLLGLWPLGFALLSLTAASWMLLQHYHRSKSFSQMIRDGFGLLPLFLGSWLLLRVGLQRPDFVHLRYTSFLPWLLGIVVFVILTERWLCEHPQFKLHSDPLRAGAVATMLFTLVIVAASSPMMAIESLSDYGRALRTTDDKIARQYVTPATEISGELGDSDCFYTLTSEGLWYYVLGRESCSRYHQVIFARTWEAQNEVKRDLEARKPGIILFSNHFWSNQIDSVSVFNSNPIVTSYVIANYEPFRNIADSWFWKRLKKPREFASVSAGHIDKVPHSVDWNEDANISGELFAVPTDDGQPTIFVTAGPDNTFIWAGHKDPSAHSTHDSSWSAVIPTARFKAPSQMLLQIWVQFTPGEPLRPIGEKFMVNAL